jgi:hypothetical protein
MAADVQYEADRLNAVNTVGAAEEQASIEAQLRTTANLIPAHVWYAVSSGATESGIPTSPCCTQRITNRYAESGLRVFALAVRARLPFEFEMLRVNTGCS